MPFYLLEQPTQAVFMADLSHHNGIDIQLTERAINELKLLSNMADDFSILSDLCFPVTIWVFCLNGFNHCIHGDGCVDVRAYERLEVVNID